VNAQSLLTLSIALAASLAILPACDDKKPTPPATTGGAGAKHDDHGHSHGGGLIDLGQATIGQFSVKAARDEGKVIAGKDAGIDANVTAAAGSTAKVAAVRFWIGTEDAKGSVKAKAEIEDPKEPSGWHTHAEIPNPMPADAKLWVEVEDDKGVKATGSFDLKA
jgi:hypothetical protein